MIDRNSLASEFNIEDEIEEFISEVNNTTGDTNPTINNPDKYVENNITKANKLLDKVLAESENGNFSPRMAEVGALLINTVNIAYEKILSKKLGESSLQIKRNMLKLKERELKYKEKMLERPQNQQNNLIITDRESMLKFLNGGNVATPKVLENKNIIDVKEEKDGDECD